jgi:uracil-DNA glycosylase family 4
MGWTERQRLMLQEMGIRLWSPVPPPAPKPRAAGVALPDAAAASPPAAVPGAAASSPATPAAQTSAQVDPRARAIAAMDWPALRDAVAACSACGLCQGRRQAVFGAGHVNAHWMIIGEAPGEQEDLKGEPFVGAAGHLLDNMLHALQLTRAEAAPERQVFIANTLKCRPPRNRNPEPAELQQCEPFLQRQIELVRPRLILAMGRFAVRALLHTNEPIGRLRGRVHRYQGVPLVVTYHPAYLLRNLADKARAWEDLCLAARTVESAGTPQLRG